jgi:hypothetical protein
MQGLPWQTAGSMLMRSCQLFMRHLSIALDEALASALHVADALVRSPECLALLLEAAGKVALDRAGAILDARVPPPEPAT